jgi:D-alanyl-D-alanine carboxypeptidase
MLLGRDPSVDGMKTGYTDAAGYCLVASAARDTTRVASAACSAWCWAPRRAKRAPPKARSC